MRRTSGATSRKIAHHLLVIKNVSRARLQLTRVTLHDSGMTCIVPCLTKWRILRRQHQAPSVNREVWLLCRSTETWKLVRLFQISQILM